MVFKRGKSPWNKGKTNVYSQEVLESNRQKHLGKKHSEKSKGLISKALTGRKFSEEHKRKIGIKTKERLLGKTLERLYGPEKALELKKKMGNNWAHKFKGNFPEETLEKKRNNMIKEKNPMYGKTGTKSPFWKGGDNESSKRSYQNNINFRLKKLIRTRIRQVLERQLIGGKIKKSIYYGINVSEIADYLKKQLPEDFNSGDYDIHHKKDLINFDLNNLEEIKKAFAPENHEILLRGEHKKKHKDDWRRIKSNSNKEKIKYLFEPDNGDQKKDTTFSSIWLFRGHKKILIAEDSIHNIDSVNNLRGNYYSRFSPLIAECIINYWSNPGDLILDSFSGRTRAIVSSLKNRRYIGFEVSKQVTESIQKQIDKGIEDKELFNEFYPRIINDDCLNINKYNLPQVDFFFTCPPYFNLEKYESCSGQLSDIDNYQVFLQSLKERLIKSCNLLKIGGYAAIVIGDFRRDKRFYVLHNDLLNIMQSSNMSIHDIIILQTVTWDVAAYRFGSVKSSKKVSKIHEYLLIFKK